MKQRFGTIQWIYEEQTDLVLGGTDDESFLYITPAGCRKRDMTESINLICINRHFKSPEYFKASSQPYKSAILYITSKFQDDIPYRLIVFYGKFKWKSLKK